MLLIPNALCCSLYKCNCVCAVTKFFTCKKLFPTSVGNSKHSCTSAGNAQAQIHFRDDQQRAFGISNISNWYLLPLFILAAKCPHSLGPKWHLSWAVQCLHSLPIWARVHGICQDTTTVHGGPVPSLHGYL